MQSISNEQVADMLRFVERQTVFVLETTADVKTYHDFLTSVSGMVLFNSTCMCLLTLTMSCKKNLKKERRSNIR